MFPSVATGSLALVGSHTQATEDEFTVWLSATELRKSVHHVAVERMTRFRFSGSVVFMILHYSGLLSID